MMYPLVLDLAADSIPVTPAGCSASAAAHATAENAAAGKVLIDVTD